MRTSRVEDNPADPRAEAELFMMRRLTGDERASKLGLVVGVAFYSAETQWQQTRIIEGNELKGRAKRLSTIPEILIFDVDGVLLDVRGSFLLSARETVRYLTGKRVTWAELHEWKSKPGNNDDWNLVSKWATALGRPTSYEEARAAFQQFYWGKNGQPGNVRKEKFLVTPAQIGRWARRFELDLFTGRTRSEFDYTFHNWPGARHFRMVVTMDDVKRKKPHPDGLVKILAGRDPATALYVGDNVDDALAARAARVPFMAIVPANSVGARRRGTQFRELGALAILRRISALQQWLTPRHRASAALHR